MENKYAHSDFDSFYLEYSPKLWRLAYRLTRNRYDSEDLVDEAFLIYLQKSITMVIDNPEAYITRILANLVRNYARLSWHNELPIDVLPESTLSTDGVGMRLREVLPKGLSPQEQEILLLRFEERLSYSEIADVLKIKEVSCRSRLMRAKAHLLNLYEKEKILRYMQHFANVQTRHLIGGEGVLKMFRGRDRRSQGGVSHNDVQIFKHLEEADVDTLVDELAVLTDDAADGNVDLDKINAYLDALDEKDPIPFGVSAEDSLAKFHARHDLLTNELSKSHQKRSKSKRIATKIAASFAVLCIVGSLTAEACGIDLFSTIARWTSEIFQLDQSGTPYAEITKYPLEIGEVKSYASLQEAVDALGVTSPLVPKYLPERYSSDGITIERRTTGVCIYADYTSINGSVGVRLKESTRAGQQTAEKDSNSQRVYVVRGIQHYIVDDGAQTKIVWANGNFECRICGDISEEEAIAIIDSIYKDG